MIDTPVGAHTCGHDDDPVTVLRVLRLAITGLTITTAVIAAGLLAIGITQEVMELWNLGCTMVILAAGGGIAIVGLYGAEQTQHGLRQAMARLDAVEAGERAIAEAVQPDDLRHRRQG